jgi:hypothetical protein
MKFRKLRIAWSVFCGLAAVLLIALWVRSYWFQDAFCVQLASQRYLGIGSVNARIVLVTSRHVGIPLSTWVVVINRKPVAYLPWFEKASWSTSTEVYVPTWLLVVLTTSVAMLPWVRHVSWRFSLRALLIATTLVAVVLGLIVRAAR